MGAGAAGAAAGVDDGVDSEAESEDDMMNVLAVEGGMGTMVRKQRG